MVSRGKDGERGYKLATLTIIDENTPIVLVIELVRESSKGKARGAKQSRKRTTLTGCWRRPPTMSTSTWCWLTAGTTPMPSAM